MKKVVNDQKAIEKKIMHLQNRTHWCSFCNLKAPPKKTKKPAAQKGRNIDT